MATTTKPNSTHLGTSERILLETACVDLIGQVEQLMEKARDEQTAGFLGESILLANTILVLVINFADAYLSGPQREVVNDGITVTHAAIKEGTELSKSQTFGPLRRLMGRNSASDEEVAQAHQAVGKTLADTVGTAIVAGLSKLDPESVIAKGMQESLQPILTELTKKW